jgi:hypothetical protein
LSSNCLFADPTAEQTNTAAKKEPQKSNEKAAMKLPPELEFYEDIHLLIYRPHGLLSEESVNKIVSIVEDLEAKLQKPFDRFFDTLGHDEVELNFKYVIQISLHRRLSYASHPPVKSAILATDSTMIHYGKMHAVLTQGSPIKVRVFQDRKEAADWLGVPVERLSAEDSSKSVKEESD